MRYIVRERNKMVQTIENVLGGIQRKEVPEDTIAFLERLLRCENLTNLRAISLMKRNGISILRLTGTFPYIDNNVMELREYLHQNSVHPKSLEIYPPDRAKLPYPEQGIVISLNLVRLYDTTIKSD